MIDKEWDSLFVRQGRIDHPDLDARIDEAELRLGSIIYSGNAREIANGVQALADWVDHRALACVITQVDDMRHDG